MCHILRTNKTARRDRGFTIPELLIVVGVIALLIAVLVPALSGALRTGDMAKAMNNMKQINTWMNLYSTENRDYVLPSEFNYTDPADPNDPFGGFPIKVRSDADLPNGQLYKGTWTDILWTYNELGSQPLSYPTSAANPDMYLYDSPDKAVYDYMPNFETPFRSPASNTRDHPDAIAGDGIPKPFGDGALEASLPGFFAANNFFSANRDTPPYNPGDPPAPTIGRWYVTSQITAPTRSMYLVDSLRGETIVPWPEPFDNEADVNGDSIPDHLEVDFRYNGVCLMLFLDGHVAPQEPWRELYELQTHRRIKINNLDKN
jgi:prepilin-type N-terminal cleavage/methylation domain-containing protein/prepilin-type processing-associated H-X9-DG protein